MTTTDDPNREEATRAVLVADDEPRIRKLLAIKLKQMGFAPLEARDGNEALDILRRAGARPPALAILDIMMPHLDGVTLLRKIREAEATRDLPVIVVTAVREPAEAAKLAALGVASILQKPFKAQDLEAAVKAALGG
jgi:DNA-binding response OmpR family regulator